MWHRKARTNATFHLSKQGIFHSNCNLVVVMLIEASVQHRCEEERHVADPGSRETLIVYTHLHRHYCLGFDESGFQGLQILAATVHRTRWGVE